MLPSHLRSEQEDDENLDSTLGKVIISDYSDSRVLDRLSIYERRIENSLFKTINELRRTQILREMEKQKKEAEEIIAAEVEEDSEILEESGFWQQDEEDSSPHEIGKSRHLTGQGQFDRHKHPSHGAGKNESGFAETKNEKQSQFANLRLESRSTKSEIRNNIKCPKNQIFETNVRC